MEVKEVLESLQKKCRERWYLLILAGVFLLALKIRLFTADAHWLQAYDPYFHLRYTSYVVEFGKLSAWDPLSYFPPGRPLFHPPLMYYLTGGLYTLFKGSFSSLMEAAKYSTAIYGAAMAIPAYLLGKEFSDWKAGVMSATFIVTIPAALRRTMAGFYDTDALVLFFTLLTMYFFARSFKRRDWTSYSLTIVSILLFSLTWPPAWYVPVLAVISVFGYFVLTGLLGKEEWDIKKKGLISKITERFKKAFSPSINLLVPVLGILIVSSVAGSLILTGKGPYEIIANYVGFSLEPSSAQIVNISVAELQNLDIFGGAWQRLYSKVSIPLVFFISGSVLLLKRSKKLGALLFTWSMFTFFLIIRGVRFMLIFAPAASVSAGVAFSEIYRNIKEMGSYAPMFSFGFLASLLISLQYPSLGVLLATALGLVMFFYKNNEELPDISKPVIIGTAVLAALIVVSQGARMASAQQGEPLSNDWKEAYSFLKHNTSQDAVVGTWWDPGHRISTIAERRNMADGAHCSEEVCDPGLNSRIGDLGSMLVTDNEDKAAETMRKYQANASEVYWIASQDLIGKYQWPQYFSTGCEGGDPNCPLYSQMRYEEQKQNKIVYQGGVYLEMKNDSFVPVYESPQGKGTFERMLYYENGELKNKTFGDGQNTISGTLWVHPRYSMVVLIPEYQKDSMFTRMYFKEDDNFDNFKKVFSNNYVKIYKLQSSEGDN